MDTPQPPEGTMQFPVRWGANTQTGPDGRTWCAVLIETPFANYGTLMPPEIADQLGKNIPGVLFNVAREARKADSTSGIVVPPFSVVSKIDGERLS